ncbi:hypothetical protein LGH70_11615 [Hymenobacter sp. BT635]|uniref:Uncharacterized protein n=1 Tax=Hymenobacter nitidus TaxID=2880929 RepID=A0ABS8ACV7_9BACT|nr:hypothetical protein [Hymenobacter nitidus]MCB2378236.1 hypothetical protein [Hymenobacter nitidus]
MAELYLPLRILMGYHLRAFVGSSTILRLMTATYPCAVLVELAQGMSLIPLTDDLFDTIVSSASPVLIPPFYYLTTELEQQVLRCVGAGALGYLEADYFNGLGEQASLLWQARQRLVWGPGPGSINIMLRQLGVSAAAHHDAFDAVGLGKHRHLEDWLPE